VERIAKRIVLVEGAELAHLMVETKSACEPAPHTAEEGRPGLLHGVSARPEATTSNLTQLHCWKAAGGREQLVLGRDQAELVGAAGVGAFDQREDRCDRPF
jgi:hypothetical protein